MNNITIKNNGASYLIFFVIGFFSFSVSINLLRIFSDIFTLNGGLGIFVFYFSHFLIFSLLFTLGLFTFKTRNFVFLLKTFTYSIIISFLILICFFMGVDVHSVFLFGIPLIFIILFVIRLQYLNEETLIRFTVKVFTISFIGFILSFGIWVMLGIIEH